MKKRLLYFSALLLVCLANTGFAQNADTPKMHIAPAPLFRCPIYDGAADPTVIYNKEKKEWCMFYTQRKANVQGPNVAYCYGVTIGLAISKDH
eukprot:gene68439-93782_t